MDNLLSSIKKNIKKNPYNEEIKEIMNKYDLNYEIIKKHIENMSIYIDFDEIIVALIPAWVEYMKNVGILNEQTNKPFIEKEIDSFDKFDKIGSKAMNFLDDFFLYLSLDEAKKINPSYERFFSEIKMKDDAIELFKILKNIKIDNIKEPEKEKTLFDNIKILTASAPKTHWSKYEFIKNNIPEINLKTQLITTGDKSNINDIREFAILIDDGIHNHVNATKNNDFITTFLLDYQHNQELKTREDGFGKRIFRIKSLSEQDFFDKLLLAAVQDIGKKIQKDLNNNLIQLPYYQEHINELKKDDEKIIKIINKIDEKKDFNFGMNK